MFKFLIILSLTVYVISKIGSFFFRIGAASQQRPVDRNRTAEPSRKEKRKGQVKGGEYIDFEEIK